MFRRIGSGNSYCALSIFGVICVRSCTDNGSSCSDTGYNTVCYRCIVTTTLYAPIDSFVCSVRRLYRSMQCYSRTDFHFCGAFSQINTSYGNSWTVESIEVTCVELWYRSVILYVFFQRTKYCNLVANLNICLSGEVLIVEVLTVICLQLICSLTVSGYIERQLTAAWSCCGSSTYNTCHINTTLCLSTICKRINDCQCLCYCIRVKPLRIKRNRIRRSYCSTCNGFGTCIEGGSCEPATEVLTIFSENR